ncbi:endonuclease/exonuclease/phosphatase family protein [Primorskyibacter sp. S187A]|uniref:endonuclease/exonuclease/phosphatase family protein n=1 Tax=Primorskyibacter sp. S187A TaxID=3415130 RepID=UPI003C7AA4F2
MAADTLRLAFWDVRLSRDGPGILLRDILRERGDDLVAARAVIAQVAPDILVLSGIDTDAEGRTLAAFADFLGGYPNQLTKVGNEGRLSGLDLNGDGRRNTAQDTLGFGNFPGNGGLAVLAREGMALSLEQDFTGLLWRDVPEAMLAPGVLAEGAEAIQPLSSTGHWVVRAGPLALLIHGATPPIFDGPEDRNGRRNHDEAALWSHVLDGHLGQPITGPFALMAKVNADPVDGEARNGAIQRLLADPRLQDPKPTSLGAVQEATPGHRGDPALDTANWDEPAPGNLRADYILPSVDLDVLDAGVMWPAPGSEVAQLGNHGLVWVDVRLPAP